MIHRYTGEIVISRIVISGFHVLKFDSAKRRLYFADVLFFEMAIFADISVKSLYQASRNKSAIIGKNE